MIAELTDPGESLQSASLAIKTQEAREEIKTTKYERKFHSCLENLIADLLEVD